LNNFENLHLHNETISRNNLYEISRNKVHWNFANLKSLPSLFRISRNKKILFRDHPSENKGSIVFLNFCLSEGFMLSSCHLLRPRLDVLVKYFMFSLSYSNQKIRTLVGCEKKEGKDDRLKISRGKRRPTSGNKTPVVKRFMCGIGPVVCSTKVRQHLYSC
jgi:hypothetical protein